MKQRAFFGLALLLAITASGGARAEETVAKYAILIDASTGTVLLDKNADERMPPASMSKLMTLYLLFERLKDGRLKLTDTFPVSERAQKTEGSRSFLRAGTDVTVEDLIRGIIVHSGNDACVVVAEGLASSEAAFAVQMTKKGRELGLTNSTFANATGLPDPNDRMTARDLATLALHIIHDFPQYYHYFSQKEFTYNNIKQGNRNPLLYKNIGADGLKTGHTSEAGYGLVASVLRDGRRLILVEAGLNSMNERSHEAQRLIDWGFREWGSYRLAKAGEVIDDAPVWLGEPATVPIVAPDDIDITMMRTSRPDMKVTLRYDGPVPAPIRKGDKIATLEVSAPKLETRTFPLVAGADVKPLGFFGRMGATIRHFIRGAMG